MTREPGVAARARLLRNYGEHDGSSTYFMGGTHVLTLFKPLSYRPSFHISMNGRIVDAESPPDTARCRPGRRRQHADRGERKAPRLSPVRGRERRARPIPGATCGLGVETGIHYPRPIHVQPAYRALGTGRDLRVSERLSSQVASLPLYPELTDAEVEFVCAALDAPS